MREEDPVFVEVFARCFPRAARVATRILGDPVAAEDIAAEALARTFANWRSAQNYEHLDAWVLRITVNLAFDALRRRRRARALALPAPNPVLDSSTAEDMLLLRESLRRLPRRQREAVVLCEYAGLTHGEVASCMGVSVNTVSTHVRRGLMTLRELMGDKTEAPLWTT